MGERRGRGGRKKEEEKKTGSTRISCALHRALHSLVLYRNPQLLPIIYVARHASPRYSAKRCKAPGLCCKSWKEEKGGGDFHVLQGFRLVCTMHSSASRSQNVQHLRNGQPPRTSANLSSTEQKDTKVNQAHKQAAAKQEGAQTRHDYL